MVHRNIIEVVGHTWSDTSQHYCSGGSNGELVVGTPPQNRSGGQHVVRHVQHNHIFGLHIMNHKYEVHHSHNHTTYGLDVVRHEQHHRSGRQRMAQHVNVDHRKGGQRNGSKRYIIITVVSNAWFAMSHHHHSGGRRMARHVTSSSELWATHGSGSNINIAVVGNANL